MKLTQDWIDFVDEHDCNIQPIGNIRMDWGKAHNKRWLWGWNKQKQWHKRYANKRFRKVTKESMRFVKPKYRQWLDIWDVI